MHFSPGAVRTRIAPAVGRRAQLDQQGPALSQQGGQGGQGGQLFHTSRIGALAAWEWHGATTSGGGCHSKDAKNAKNANFFIRRDAAPGSAGLPFVGHATANRASLQRSGGIVTNPRQPSRKALQGLCSETGPEDGVDPRDALRQAGRKTGGRKTQQLCGQVAEALNYAFAGVCNDDVLRELGVVAVRPAPDEARLLVTVGPLLPGPCDPAQITAHLHQALGKLRAEIAAAIHRKKVPELTFAVMTNVTG